MACRRRLLEQAFNQDVADRYAERIVQEVQREPQKWRYDFLNVRCVVRKTKASAQGLPMISSQSSSSSDASLMPGEEVHTYF